MSLILDDIEHNLTTEELLLLIVKELRILNTYMEEGFEEKITLDDVEEPRK